MAINTAWTSNRILTLGSTSDAVFDPDVLFHYLNSALVDHHRSAAMEIYLSPSTSESDFMRNLHLQRSTEVSISIGTIALETGEKFLVESKDFLYPAGIEDVQQLSAPVFRRAISRTPPSETLHTSTFISLPTRTTTDPVKPDELSGWAIAIGPLYTVRRAARECQISEENIEACVEINALVSVKSREGDLLLPVLQFTTDGRPVGGLKWILDRLHECSMNSYMLAAWLNTPTDVLGGRSPYKELRFTKDISSRLRSAVEDLRERMLQ